MAITPFHLWLLSVGATLFVKGKRPEWRIPRFFLLAGHAAAFLRGVFDIRSQFFGPVRWRGEPEDRTVALTFDDGPDPNLTNDVLEILSTYNIKATFFVIGARAKRYPVLITKIIQSGHTIGCHDLNHELTSNFRLHRRLVKDISKARGILNDITGFTPRLYRPPVGLMNPHVSFALEQLDMECIGWSKSAREAGNRRLPKIMSIDTLAGPGEIILLHDCLPLPDYKKQYINKLEMLCRSIQEKKLRAVTVDELFDINAYSLQLDDF